jgi:hypothetical protein
MMIDVQYYTGGKMMNWTDIQYMQNLHILRLEGETVWLTQEQIAYLFDTKRHTTWHKYREQGE